MWWVSFAASKHIPFAQIFKPKVDNLLHKLWHNKEYLGAEQLLDFQ
jgi:hypothetical protein